MKKMSIIIIDKLIIKTVDWKWKKENKLIIKLNYW